MTSFTVKLRDALRLTASVDPGMAEGEHSGMVSQTTTHSGFDPNLDQVYKAIKQQKLATQVNTHRFGTVSMATAQASQNAVTRSIDRIRNGMNSVQIASALVEEAKAGQQISFNDAEVRKELHKKVAKLGGRVGNLVTGETILAEYIKASSPNSSASVFKVPTLARTLRNNKNPDDRIIKMLKNIADKGYVLQQARGK